MVLKALYLCFCHVNTRLVSIPVPVPISGWHRFVPESCFAACTAYLIQVVFSRECQHLPFPNKLLIGGQNPWLASVHASASTCVNETGGKLKALIYSWLSSLLLRLGVKRGKKKIEIHNN